MRRFIKKYIFMCLPIIAVAIGMEILLRNMPNDYLLKKEYLDSHSAEIETLILGSSHSFYGINPAYFSTKTFNASHVSQSIDYDLEILEKYQSNFKKLKTIILPVSYFTLFENLETEPDAWRIKNYTIYYEMNTSKSFIYHSEVLSNRVSINLKRLGLYYILNKPMISCTQLGWGTNFHSKNAVDLIISGRSTALQHSKDINSNKIRSVLKNNKLILASIVEWCRNRNIRLVLFTPPAFETYRQNLNKEQLYITIETAQRIDLENDNCIYVNLLEDMNFVKKDFYDADHLSEIGAEKLSKLMTNKIDYFTRP